MTGDDAMDREALPPAECAAVAGDFFRLLRWQASHQVSRLITGKLVNGALAHDAEAHGGELLTALLVDLWLPTRVPREGRGR